MIPKKLIEIKKFLDNEKIKLSKKSRDGRINSALNEDILVKLISNNFEINLPRARDWVDFSFEEKSILYPVNIKIIETTKNDNLSCKLGIYYALTGMIPDFGNELGWSVYFKKLKENLGRHENRDYYFLVYNKTNGEIFVNSLKGLNVLVANGNNLPFQCKWDLNKNFKNRSFEESCDFIMKKFSESIKLRANILSDFKKYFKNYV